jgi:phosphoserine phosphatase
MAIARSDLPLAVGPHTIRMFKVMSKTVVTLIAAGGKEKLSPALLTRISGLFAKEGAIVLGREWLAEETACDITCARIEPEIAEAIAVEGLEGAAIDCIAQDTGNRQKRMLISDMDSTIITIECIDEIADFAGVKEKVAGITERAMRGEIDFPAALKERVSLLKGLPEVTLQQVYDERVVFMPGARELVATMRANGAYTILVSGGFDFFTSRVKDALGFHADSSNRFEIEGGKLTGNVLPPILDKSSKLETLMQVSSERGISLSDILAAGDGANDVPMLLAAGLGVAYHAKPLVQKSARVRINHCDLTALLYAQGYHEAEIVSG